MNRFVPCALALLVASFAPAARAQSEPTTAPVQANLLPVEGHPYLFILQIGLSIWTTADVVADRRLVQLELRHDGSRRVTRCRAPDAPRAVDASRIRTLSTGGSASDPATEPTYQEWIDLRAYCWGRARTELEQGARVTLRYGFAGRGRNRWVVRPPPDEGAPLHVVVGEEVIVAPSPAPTPVAPAHGTPAGLLRLSLAPADVADVKSLVFRVTLEATPGRTARVYPRDDLFSFFVEGPLGSVECRVPFQRIVPIIDFYRTLSGRRRATHALDAERYCPEHTFDAAGVYEVSPRVELVYDGEQHELRDVVTGTITGARSAVRIRRGDLGYVEQVPQSHPAIAHAAQGGRP